jgi:hypothetical protein
VSKPLGINRLLLLAKSVEKIIFHASTPGLETKNTPVIVPGETSPEWRSGDSALEKLSGPPEAGAPWRLQILCEQPAAHFDEEP